MYVLGSCRPQLAVLSLYFPGQPAPALHTWSAALLRFLYTWLPISAPPTSLDECFFNSLVPRLPCSLIFWQFWLFIYFKLVVILLLIVQGIKAFVPKPASWLELLVLLLVSLLWLQLSALHRITEVKVDIPIFFPIFRELL